MRELAKDMFYIVENLIIVPGKPVAVIQPMQQEDNHDDDVACMRVSPAYDFYYVLV